MGVFFFFFQAEDGIRDLYVTGVKTCALPISGLQSTCPRSMSSRLTPRRRQPTLSPAWPWSRILRNISTPVTTVLEVWVWKIGRASCRERVSISVGAVSVKKKEGIYWKVGRMQ